MDLETSLNNERLQLLVGRMENLPSVPSLYSEIVDKMHDPEVVLEDVGAIIAKDAGMTAKMLKLVNSAFFGLRREVSSPAEAVAYLGLDTIKSLVLSMHAFSQFETASAAGFSLATVWNNSMATAAAAKQITRIEVNDCKMMDEAFVAGLLHDAGKIALAFNFPDEYSQIMAQTQATGGNLLQAEQKILGANHADVAGYLLGLWGLPTPVVEAIALHHHPSVTQNNCFSPLTAVHIANALLNAGPDHAPALDTEYLARLHCPERLDAWRETILQPATPE